MQFALDTLEIENIAYNEGVSFYPFLWAKAESINTRSRLIIPMPELVKLELEMYKKYT